MGAILLAAPLLASACGGPSDDISVTGLAKPDPSPARVTDVLAADEEGRFDLLVELVGVAGLTAALEEPGPFTLFVPTDEVLEDTFSESELEGLREDTDTLAEVLSYHVVEGAAVTSDQIDGTETLETVQGGEIEVTTSGVNDASFEETDIDAPNGVIHVINGVLEP
ncbi:MAG: fasciclin domain-containing protein [Actinomycetota bacterium]|nr:fasciclin domain-containing protein [Actinomycetota bacterium]